jgi:hypothetical protein
MNKPNKYVGINQDSYGGMSAIGRIIRDAWVFGLLAENETCAGWTPSMIEVLLHQVNAEWDKYGCMVSQLPPELRERHARIYAEGLKIAKAAGWSGEHETAHEG